MTLEGARHLTWIAERDGRPLGMIWPQLVRRVSRPHLRDRFSGHLQTFWVRPDERRNGIGTLLLEALFAEADRRGLERVVLHSSPGALPLYERMGFAHDGLIVSRPLPRA